MYPDCKTTHISKWAVRLVPCFVGVHHIFCFSLILQLFAYLGFVVSVLWIYSIANEIVNLLQVSYNI